MWKNGHKELDTQRFHPALALLLEQAMERAVRERLVFLGEADVLYTLLTLSAEDPEVLALSQSDRDELNQARGLVENHLAEGVRRKDCLTACGLCAEGGYAQPNPFLRSFFREPLGGWLDDLEDGAAITDVLEKLFGHPEQLPDHAVVMGLFRCEELHKAILANRNTVALFNGEGQIRREAFRERALILLERALALAPRCGERPVQPAHLLAAMLLCKESYTCLLLRRVGANPSGTGIATCLQNAFPQDDRSAAALEPVRKSFSEELAQLLDEAFHAAVTEGEGRVGEREMLSGLLRCRQAGVQHLFRSVLKIDPSLCLNLLEELDEPEVIEPELPLELCACRNLTALNREVVLRMGVVESVIKVFFRGQQRTVLLHGEPGVGLSSVGDMVARVLRQGTCPSLRGVPVIRFDLSAVEESGYDQAVLRLLRFVEEEPERIYVLEGFGAYLKQHSAEATRRLRHSASRLLIVVSETDFAELAKIGQQLRECLTPVAVPEPDEGETLSMLELAMPQIGGEYGVQFTGDLPSEAYRLAKDYLLSQRFPKKAISLLSMAAADTAAEAEIRGEQNPTVTRERLAAVMSRQTGLSAESILTGPEQGYVCLLSRNLLGQEAAVARAAGRLDLIQRGMVDKTAPAAVLLFAGLSGTGKTELARQMARIYASSRRLIRFSMESFCESGSVSRLIGTPPGCAGYEEGGKLINDLNRDPYSVVLLDKAEKAHPAVWDPLLNLFDEGVITDTRGVTASGSRAIFVLTTGIGQYEIASMLRQGRPMEEIENVVKNRFINEAHQRSGEPCFPPELLGRIMGRGGIVVFSALSLEALTGIAGHSFSKIARRWKETQGSSLVCDDDVLEMAAKIAFDRNEEAIRRGNGYLGGRELDGLMNHLIQEKLARQIRQLSGAALVRVVREGNDTDIVPVYSEADAQELMARTRLALVDKMTRRFSRLTMADTNAFARLGDEKLSRLSALLSEIDGML